MKKIKLITVFIIFISIFISLIPMFAPPASAAVDPLIKANAAFLLETRTGKVLYAKNADAQIYPASITKVMTALLAIESIEDGYADPDVYVEVNETAFFDITPDGSTQKILPGETLTLESLLYCAMISSANEACNIVAEHISGSVSKFVALMNKRAEELGCTGTNFANTHGLPDENHFTTARDLSIITAAANKYSLFRKISSTINYTVPATNKSPERKLTTTNRLLVPDSLYYYKGASGTKTGHTFAAGYCLVSTAARDEMEIISVVMGTESVLLEDGTTQIQSFSETRRLLDWAFSSFSFRTVLETTDLIAEIPVKLGKDADAVVLRPQEGIVSLLDKDIDVSAFERRSVLYTEDDGTLMAPVAVGDVLGEVTVSYNGEVFGTVKLIANSNIELSKFDYMKSEISRVLSSTWAKLIFTGLVIIFGLYLTFIIIYNRKKKLRRLAAQEERARLMAELRERPTMGKSFEDIEDLYSHTSRPPSNNPRN